jgi:hypothetical protein
MGVFFSDPGTYSMRLTHPANLGVSGNGQSPWKTPKELLFDKENMGK